MGITVNAVYMYGILRHLNFIKKQKLCYLGHIKRHQTLEKLILQGKVKGQRNRGRPNISWEKDVDDCEWGQPGQVSG